MHLGCGHAHSEMQADMWAVQTPRMKSIGSHQFCEMTSERRVDGVNNNNILIQPLATTQATSSCVKCSAEKKHVNPSE